MSTAFVDETHIYVTVEPGSLEGNIFEVFQEGAIILSPDSPNISNLTILQDATINLSLSEMVYSFQLPHTWALNGELSVTDNDQNYIPPFFVPAPAGQSVVLSNVRCMIDSGTSATIKITKNNLDIPGLENILVTQTPGSSGPINLNLTDNDFLKLQILSLDNQPKNMTVTVFLQYTV